MKKANSQAFRIAEVRKSARKFLHGRNFKQQSNKKSRLDKKSTYSQPSNLSQHSSAGWEVLLLIWNFFV